MALPLETSIVITPDPSRRGPDYAMYQVSESKISKISLLDVAVHRALLAPQPLDISMEWPDETNFEHRTSRSPDFGIFYLPAAPAHDVTPTPLTHISVQRTLKGSSQAQGQLSVVVTNHLPISIQASYLESMPWLLQFYLHSLKIYYDGVSRGTSGVDRQLPL